MSPKIILVLASLVALGTNSVYSDPKPLSRPSNDKAQEHSKAETDTALVRRLVQIARAKYKARNLEEADTLLKAALKIQPQDCEAWYYLHSVHNAIRENKLWYPTIPPRAASK